MSINKQHTSPALQVRLLPRYVLYFRPRLVHKKLELYQTDAR